MGPSSISGSRRPARRHSGTKSCYIPRPAGSAWTRPAVFVYITPAMSRLSPSALALLLAAAAPVALRAQETGGGPCAQPDSIVVRGNDRVTEPTVRADAGLAPGVVLNFRVVQRAIKALYATGNYESIALTCMVDDSQQHANLVLTVRERPVLGDVRVEGVKRVSERSVKDRVELLIGRPVDPLLVAKAVARIDSLYEAEGYYLARVRPETTM